MPGPVTRIKQLSRQRWWGLWLALFATGLSWFMSYPYWPKDHHHWQAYEAKAAAPFVSLADRYPAADHAAKLDFRLTVPVVAHLLGLERTGMRILYLALSAGTLWMAYGLFMRHSQDRISSTLLVLGLAAIPMGSEAQFGRFFFDPAAFFLATACLLVRSTGSLTLLLFLLSFVDERAFVMFPAIGLYHALRSSSDTPVLATTAKGLKWQKPLICMIGVLALHGAVRFWLRDTFGLRLPLGSVLDTEWLVRNFRYAQLMVLATLEFSWLWAVPALVLLWKRGSPLVCLLLCAAFALPLASALVVADVGRSMNYALPAVLTLAATLPQLLSLSNQRTLLLVAAALNLLFWNIDYIESPRPSPPAVAELARLVVEPKPVEKDE